MTRARAIRFPRAISAWLVASPDSSRACHSLALRSSSTSRSAGTRRIRVPMLPFSKAPFGPRAISTVCFAVGGPGRAIAGLQGDVDDAEPDLGLGDRPRAASNTVTSGEFVS